nr:hypothetical protein Iba_chr11aCG9560 [Ipomoea batatas]
MDSLIMILYGVVGLIEMGLEPETFRKALDIFCKMN